VRVSRRAPYGVLTNCEAAAHLRVKQDKRLLCSGVQLLELGVLPRATSRVSSAHAHALGTRDALSRLHIELAAQLRRQLLQRLLVAAPHGHLEVLGRADEHVRHFAASEMRRARKRVSKRRAQLNADAEARAAEC
jgi:hypothetical protein